MSQYFSSSNKRGELNELHEELNNPKFERKKEALKKVIAHMTIGKDVSPLFQSVIKCLEVNDLEIIKLVYLYIINYSRNKPDDAIMVVERFRKVTKSPFLKRCSRLFLKTKHFPHRSPKDFEGPFDCIFLLNDREI